jgi:dethiobiotin synthetase
MILAFFGFFGFVQSQNCDGKKMQNSQTNVSATTKAATKFERLPENVKPETEVRKETRNAKGEVISFEITTVEKRLNELKARYEKDKLVDEKGVEIRFFEPLCRGVSAGEEQDEIDRKAKEKELAELEKKYTVIVLHCDPTKIM